MSATKNRGTNKRFSKDIQRLIIPGMTEMWLTASRVRDNKISKSLWKEYHCTFSTVSKIGNTQAEYNLVGGIYERSNSKEKYL